MALPRAARKSTHESRYIRYLKACLATKHFKSWPIFTAPTQRGCADSGCEPMPVAGETTAAAVTVSGTWVWTAARSKHDHKHVPAAMTRAQRWAELVLIATSIKHGSAARCDRNSIVHFTHEWP